MKMSEAKKHLNTMMYAVQKLRSIMNEQGFIAKAGSTDSYGFDMTEEQAAHAWGWVWGEKCVVPFLQKVLDTEALEPMAFYNMMAIALTLEPIIGACAWASDPTFPKEINIYWMRGWDPEEKNENQN